MISRESPTDEQQLRQHSCRGLYLLRTKLPYLCHICHNPSANQICIYCDDLFSRGLKSVKQMDSKIYDKLSIYSIRYEMRKYVQIHKLFPNQISMNMTTYRDFIVANPQLSTLSVTREDSKTKVNDIPIVVRKTMKELGYRFIGPSASDTALL